MPRATKKNCHYCDCLLLLTAAGLLVLVIMFFAVDRSDIITSSLPKRNNITVNDQTFAPAVVVSDVQLMKGGFLIIQKGVGEMPGSVLGTSLFLDAGFYQNIGIVLSPESNVEAGDVLFVGVIYDVNHDRRYDNTDFVNSPKDQNGWPLRAAFSVRESN